MSKSRSIFRPLALALFMCTMPAGVSFLWSQSASAQELPKVELTADSAGPRQVEELTATSVPRDYAYAWQTMAQALESNRADLLDGYFTGFAKEDLLQRIAGQKRTGIHARYRDQGHKLEVLFYSPSGDAMQLRDRARLEIEILDGSNVLHREQVTLQHIVLMTPGADRWLVRDLETTPEAHP